MSINRTNIPAVQMFENSARSLVLTPVDAANGMKILQGKARRLIVMVQNNGVDPCTVSLPDFLRNIEVAVTIPAGETRVIGPINSQRHAEPGTGFFLLNFDQGADVLVGGLRIGH